MQLHSDNVSARVGPGRGPQGLARTTLPTPRRGEGYVEKANTKLRKLGIAPIEGATFHGLRRTYASLRAAVGDDPAYTSEQIGHDDPRFTLRVYTYATKRRQRLTGTHRRAFDQALEWAQMGTNADIRHPRRSLASQR